MLAFSVESATHGIKGRGKRKDISADEEIRVLGPHGMPINTVSRDRNLRYQVGACQGNALRRESAKSHATDHPVLLADLVDIEEAMEFLGLDRGRYGRRQSYPKSFRPNPFNTLPCARPCAPSAMTIVPLGCRAVEADLQCHAFAWQ